MKIHHIGIIVSCIQESIRIFAHLGFTACTEILEDFYQHNKIIFLENANYPIKIELVEALNEESTIKGVKPGFHHICYECNNEILQEFPAWKIGKIFTPQYIAPALGDRKVVFACLKNGCFIEFILEESKNARDMLSNSPNS